MGGHPAAGAPRSWLTSPFRAAGLVPVCPLPPRSSTLQRAGCLSRASGRCGRAHAAAGNSCRTQLGGGDIRSPSPPRSRGLAPAGPGDRTGVSSRAWMPASPAPCPVPGKRTCTRGRQVPGCAGFQPPRCWARMPAGCQALPPSHSPLPATELICGGSGPVRAPSAATRLSHTTWPEPRWGVFGGRGHGGLDPVPCAELGRSQHGWSLPDATRGQRNGGGTVCQDRPAC